jgi:hypothetical protein
MANSRPRRPIRLRNAKGLSLGLFACVACSAKGLPCCLRSRSQRHARKSPAAGQQIRIHRHPGRQKACPIESPPGVEIANAGMLKVCPVFCFVVCSPALRAVQKVCPVVCVLLSAFASNSVTHFERKLGRTPRALVRGLRYWIFRDSGVVVGGTAHTLLQLAVPPA